jgi:hypothetical protein
MSASLGHEDLKNTTASEKIIPGNASPSGRNGGVELPNTKSAEAGLGMVDPHDETTARLQEMGYKQEMKRSLGMVAVLGLSFAIMAVPFGTSTTLNTALVNGGPATIIWGVSGGRHLARDSQAVMETCLTV